MKNRLKLKIWAGVLLVLFFGWIVADNTIFKGGFSSQNIVVASDKIPVDSIIEEEHVTVQKIPNEYVTEGMIKDPAEVVGKRTTTIIEKFDSFSKNKIGDPSLKKNKNEYFFSIPSSWIESVPGSLRRLDTVDLWLSKPEGRKSTVQEDLTNIEEELGNAAKPIASDLIVAFIKNSQNTEVQGAEEKTDRLDGNSSPSQIEVLMKKDDFSKLNAAIAQGYKIIVSY
ncbi:SAF domain-containing protein [Fictibacillus sp. 7GRE50]|uniref:SAF domain-containing protein n=1 Tax=Fictibacillus sp. 7GRE50 TaxID=2745878 RepID=UPI0018CFC07D|nr:SAF domain-containing protein [Fictibacillus sp. 7GRE50]MBH0167155.1 SAF domain-containing protein [Fictibacillus sp. 7GRE50]